MTAPAEPQGPPAGEEDPLIDSRLSYVVGGAVSGAAYGLFYLLEEQGKRGASGSLTVPAISLVAGTLVGLELHATRAWGRKGPFHNLGRWVFAFVSAAATIGFVLRLTGDLTGREYLGLLGFAAFVGLSFGFRSLRDDWSEKATPDQKFNLRLVLIVLLCAVAAFAYAVS